MIRKSLNLTQFHFLKNIPEFSSQDSCLQLKLMIIVKARWSLRREVKVTGSTLLSKGISKSQNKMIVHSDPRLPMLEYKLLEPSLKKRLKYSSFFENYDNLIVGENTQGIDEIRRFKDKRTIKNLVVRIIGDRDTLGLEEIIMASPNRFLSAKCISKKARIISIEGKALFLRIKREDIMEMFEQTSLKKLKILSESIGNYKDHLIERKQTINTDRIMERIEYFEPMMTDIYLRSDMKLEAERCVKLTKKSIRMKESRNFEGSQNFSNVTKQTEIKNPFKNEKIRNEEKECEKPLNTITTDFDKITNKSFCNTLAQRMKRYKQNAKDTETRIRKNLDRVRPVTSKTERKFSKRNSQQKFVINPIEDYKCEELLKEWDIKGLLEKGTCTE